jgi:multidrug resistance efflux pump
VTIPHEIRPGGVLHRSDGEILSDADRRLPTIDESNVPSYHLARHALKIILLTVLALVASAVVASFLIEMNVTSDADGAMEQVAIWPIRPRQAGVISDVLVGTGDTVRQGQPILQLDTIASANDLRTLHTQLRSSEEDFAKASATIPLNTLVQAEKIGDAEAKLVHAHATLRDKLVEMSIRGNADSVLRAYVTGTNTNVDLAIADVHSAEATLRSVHTSLALARVDSADLIRREIDLTKIRGDIEHAQEQRQELRVLAPIGGVVLTDQLQQLVGSHVTAGEQVLAIADSRGWRAALVVAERDVHDVQIGQAAMIEIPALKQLDGRRIRGRVVSVAPEPAVATPGTTGPATGGYRVVVELNAAQVDSLGVGQLRRGYGVHGKIVTRSGRIVALILAYIRDSINELR